MSNYYNLLEVKMDDTLETIKKSYKRLALENHPDKNPSRIEECTKRFKLISEAYGVLSNEQKRKDYDLTILVNRKSRPDPTYNATVPRFFINNSYFPYQQFPSFPQAFGGFVPNINHNAYTYLHGHGNDVFIPSYVAISNEFPWRHSYRRNTQFPARTQDPMSASMFSESQRSHYNRPFLSTPPPSGFTVFINGIPVTSFRRQ